MTFYIRLPITDVGEKSPRQTEEKEVKGARIVVNTDDSADAPAREVVVINEEEDESYQGKSEVPTVASDYPKQA